jgi:phage shock protein A
MENLTTTEADLQNLIATQSQQLTNANLTIIALNRAVRELEAELTELKPEKKAAEKKS